MKLDGKVSLVSACGRGIGKEIALTLAREGSNLIINSFSEENTQAVAKEVEGLGVKVVAVTGDITRSAVILETVAAGIEAFGQIDILVNNVGGGSVAEIDDKDNPLAEVEAMWDGTYAMSLKAPVLMCEAVMPHLIEKKSGKIINISSLAGRPGMPHVDLVPLSSSYHSTKAGLIRYTQLLADQMGRYNINVNAICPGYIETAIQDELTEQDIKDSIEKTPLPRLGLPKDIGLAALFLASDDAEWITGISLIVDGGMLAPLPVV